MLYICLVYCWISIAICSPSIIFLNFISCTDLSLSLSYIAFYYLCSLGNLFQIKRVNLGDFSWLRSLREIELVFDLKLDMSVSGNLAKPSLELFFCSLLDGSSIFCYVIIDSMYFLLADHPMNNFSNMLQYSKFRPVLIHL